jgi:phospholipid/cholesterol/gamma-HCH transport system ATP-binding protein
MIKIKNLWKAYGKLQVLKGLDLQINEGEILVILGRSGVGKSILLKHIIGLEKPDKGSIEINGVNISTLKEKEFYEMVRHMGMLFQGSALFDSMTVEENTGFYLANHKDLKTNKRKSKEEIKQIITEALKMVSLEGTESKMPSDLSGGMRRRAALARLIAYRPKILLYDEPTTGLDPITAQQINELIVKTQKELGGTSIVVTHDIKSAIYIADRLALHEDGKITHVAKTNEFLNIDNPIISFLKESLTHHPRANKESHDA